MTFFLALDDTDMPGTRGTGRLARGMVQDIEKRFPVKVTGITRHQLFVHPTIPYTSHNSAAVLHIQKESSSNDDIIDSVFSYACSCVMDDFIEGSDPGVAVAEADQVSTALVRFGSKAKSSRVTQDEAWHHAKEAGIQLSGLGGTSDGIIGALASIGLAASGSDGRFIMKDMLRDLMGPQPLSRLYESGVDVVRNVDGTDYTYETVHLHKFPKPALIDGKAVLFVVEHEGQYWDVTIG